MLSVRILAGRTVKQQREIAVRVSKGPEEVEMPSFVGLTFREAKVALTQAGFVEGKIRKCMILKPSPV